MALARVAGLSVGVGGAAALAPSLREIASGKQSWFSSAFISAVVLIADRAKMAHGAEAVWDGAYDDARTGVIKADGIWTKTFPAVHGGTSPSQIAGRKSRTAQPRPGVRPPGVFGALDFGAWGGFTISVCIPTRTDRAN
jgi:hypothetical protein